MPLEFVHEGMVFPGTLTSVDYLEKTKLVQMKPDDVVIDTYPKAGKFTPEVGWIKILNSHKNCWTYNTLIHTLSTEPVVQCKDSN